MKHNGSTHSELVLDGFLLKMILLKWTEASSFLSETIKVLFQHVSVQKKGRTLNMIYE